MTLQTIHTMIETRQTSVSRIFAITALLVFVIFSLSIWNCKDPVGSPYSNTFPETRLANVPANDTIAQYIRLGAIPEQTLYWVGDDPDGYVIAYRYRWTDFYQGQAVSKEWTTVLNITSLGGMTLDTLILVRGNPSSLFRIYNFFATLDPYDFGTRERIRDSLATGRVFPVPYGTGIVRGDSIIGASPINLEAPTKGIFIFYSPSDSNMHRFEVASVDNIDAVDPTPATVHFWTLRSPGPTVFFARVPPNGQLILRYPTEVNPGLTFTFGALDPSTDRRDYSWVIDDTADASRWSPWTPQAQAIVTAIYFQQTGSDTHTIFLRARNRWGVLSPIVLRKFTASVPPIDDPNWPKRILIINNCRMSGPGSVDTSTVNSFYSEVMDSLGKTGKFDIWTVATPHPPLASYAFPPREIMGRYTAVLLLSEQYLRPPTLGSGNLILQTKQAILRVYLSVGGKLIYSGTPDIRNTILPLTLHNAWAYDIFHIASYASVPFIQDTALDFVGANGTVGYPNVALDSAKIPADSGRAIRNIAINFPRGFGQTISFFDSKANKTDFENKPLGVRYLAPPPIPPARQTYSVIHFGFPLYYGRKTDVIQALRKAFADLNE